MSVSLRKPMTVEAFLTWEERWEFDGLGPVAMTGRTNAHEAIGGNLRSLLLQALRGTPCAVRGPTLKIEASGRIRYPDAFIFCSAARRDQTVIADSVVVFEVLSQSTSRIDRIEKLREYQATPSIRRYVILEQDAVAATVYLKRDESWTVSVLTGDAVLAMPEVNAEIPLPGVYADVELPSADTAEG
ncbi:Uma2 family endonuclease [Rhodopila sp.]|uniref:Uma2 family endonuclease n=1 Tax=Rhodopila sp. TaxID=2480087 RepID=UPI003D12C6F6